MKDPSSYPVLYDSQITTTGSGAVYEPGTVFVHRSGTGRAQFALVEYIRLDNNGCSQGESLVTDFGTTVHHGVAKSATSDGRAAHFRGFAAATIASNAYGFSIIGGYCEKADTSQTTASGHLISISGSTAGKCTSLGCGTTWNATLGLSSTVGTAGFAIAIARGAFATGVGSVSIIGVWA